MILADGRVVTTSTDLYPDLFWAVRGAGQCFGVATEFTYRAWNQGSVWAGMLVSFANWNHEQAIPDCGMGMGFTTPPGAPGVVVFISLFYNGSEEDAKAYYKALFDIGPIVNHTGPMPYEKVNGIFNDAQGFGGRKLFGGSNIAFPFDTTFIQSIFDEFVAFTGTHEGTSSSIVMFEFLPYEKTVSVGVEETAFANRGEYYNVCTTIKWDRPELDQEVRLFNRQINSRIREQGGKKKTDAVGVYANY